MTAIRISMVVGLAAFGVLMLNGVSPTTALFRGFIVFMGMAALLMVFKHVVNIIRPPAPPPAPRTNEDEE